MDHEDAQASAERLLGLTKGFTDTHLILGDNWLLNLSSFSKNETKEIADQLGGRVIIRENPPPSSLTEALTLEDAAAAYGNLDLAECATPEPEDVGELDAIHCEDDTYIMNHEIPLGSLTAEEESDAISQVAQSFAGKGSPIVSERFIVVLRGSVDAQSAARELEGTLATADTGESG
ncbi:hypothetical protein [Kytococcus sedentarius]|uniref:hypothetical protein n=1 Tax=Kytococcus sedentarius TaxID=1276 RepID=UPI00384EBE78